MNRRDLLAKKATDARALAAKEQEAADRIKARIAADSLNLSAALALVEETTNRALGYEAQIAALDSCDYDGCDNTASWEFTPLDVRTRFAEKVIVAGGNTSKSCFEHMAMFGGPEPTIMKEILR